MKQDTSNLSTIIKLLEKERRSLKKMIKKAEAEGNILIIYHHSQALQETDRQLDIFYQFRDPAHSKKIQLERYIQYLQNEQRFKQQRSKNLIMNEFLANRINNAKNELQQLNDIPNNDHFIATTNIEEALLAMYEKRCKSFKLVLNEETKFGLHFKLKKHGLEITMLPNVDLEEPDIIYKERIPQPHVGMGFNYDIKRKKYIYAHQMNTEYDIAMLKYGLLGSCLIFAN